MIEYTSQLVTLLAYAQWSGSVGTKQISVTGPVIWNAIKLISTIFPGKHISHYKGHRSIDTHTRKKDDVFCEKIYITNKRLVEDLKEDGWMFSRDNRSIPSQVLSDVSVFRSYVAALIDSIFTVEFRHGDISSPMRVSAWVGNERSLAFVLYILHLVEGVEIDKFVITEDRRTSRNSMYKIFLDAGSTNYILDFVGSLLSRPRNKSLIRYRNENIEARRTGKDAFYG